MTEVKHGRSRVLKRDLQVAPANIGPRSTPNYDALADAATYKLPNGVKVFAGPRDDPFFVDLGSIFDLGGLRPLNGAHLIPRSAEAGVDGVAGYNTHTIAIQVPSTRSSGCFHHNRSAGGSIALIGNPCVFTRQRASC